MRTFVSMLQQVISFEEFNFSSKLIRDLVAEKSDVKAFVSDFFDLEKVEEAAAGKNFSKEFREILHKVLYEQNKPLTISSKTRANIDSLIDPNTFTITTGHQLNLFTGPLYSIYKVAQVISITNALNERNNNKKFVPVFWMATEDHDFEEINHIHLFGKKIQWKHGDEENKVVGRISTVGIQSFIEEIKGVFSNPSDLEKLQPIFDLVLKAENLAQATRFLINHFFGDDGIVIIDGDDAILKKVFQPVAEKEILTQVTNRNVRKVNESLDAKGYHNQVFLRNSNLFYIDDNGVRERLSFENNVWLVGNNKVSQQQLLSELRESPEKFSPNALLRPIYQETILPNLVYVGGGGEIAYWLQLKSLFQELNLNFPLLRVRDSVILLRDKDFETLEQNELSILELGSDLNKLLKERVLEEAGGAIIIDEVSHVLAELKSNISDKVAPINKGALQSVDSTLVRVRKEFEKLENNLVKARKDKDQSTIRKLEKLKEKIYPEGGFQERFNNVLDYWVNHDKFVENIMVTCGADTSPKINVVGL